MIEVRDQRIKLRPANSAFASARCLRVESASPIRKVIMDRKRPDAPHEAVPDDTRRERDLEDDVDVSTPSEPPFTKSGNIAAPKFGSAGSGGAELEPGPER